MCEYQYTMFEKTFEISLLSFWHFLSLSVCLSQVQIITWTVCGQYVKRLLEHISSIKNTESVQHSEQTFDYIVQTETISIWVSRRT